MIVQDQYSGSFHEVPDQPGGIPVGEVAYDGLGNPVGFIGPLRDIVSNIPIVGGLVNRLLPGAPPPPPPGIPAPFPIATPPMLPPGLSTLGPAVSNLMQQFGPSIPRPWPLGWIRPPLPYTGLGPRRLYMRCAVWPGPRGLVPEYAANMPPGTQPQPGLPGFPGMPGAMGPYGGGRRRRRRR